jgi:hydroxymethylbilane synthase
MKLIAGTRGSQLALKQVEIIKKKLLELNSKVEVKTKIIHTLGDKYRDRPIESLNEKGVFTKVIDEAVLNSEVDFAVHSMKDLPLELHDEITIAAIPKRSSPFDVLVTKTATNLKTLPKSAVLGTASPRRKAQVLYIRNDLEVYLIRGNVDTRLRKLQEGEYDAIILAESGLLRLGKEDIISEKLSLEDFTPSACQGALALVARKDDIEVNNILNSITHTESMITTQFEREFMTTIGGGCKTPLGVIVKSNKRLELLASILAPDGSSRFQFRASAKLDNLDHFARKAALEMLDQGAASLIKRWSK